MAGLAETVSLAAPSQIVFGAMNAAPPAVQTYSLPPLPYAYDALEPHISSEIMTLHHDKHHQAYVTNLNVVLANYSTAAARGHVVDQIALMPALRFNGGGHINHALFWPTLAPANSADAKDPKTKAPQLLAALEDTYGSLDGFTRTFATSLLAIQGSGWGWLVRSESDKNTKPPLTIVTTKDQDPIVDGIPIIGIDMWEHAYYLQYKNGKQSYVDNIWKIINWTVAEGRYTGTRDETYDFITVSLTT